MKIKVDAKVLADKLQVISKLAAPATGNINIKSSKNKVHIRSDGTASRVIALLPCTVEGDGEVAVSLEALSAAVKGRKALEIEFAKSVLAVKDGSYKATLATGDILNPEYDEDKISSEVTLEPEQAKWLKSAATAVALKPSLESYMPLGVKLTSKGAFVSCFNRDHLAYIKSNAINGDMDLTLPLDVMQQVLDVFSLSSFKIGLGVSNLHCTNKLFRVQIALPQEDDGVKITLGMVIENAKAMGTMDSISVEIPKADILAFLDNAKAVVTKERPEMTIECNDGKLKLEVETVNGSAKQLIKVKSKSFGLNIDYEHVEEAVRKCGDEVLMRVVKDKFVSFHRKAEGLDSVTVVSVNQRKAK